MTASRGRRTPFRPRHLLAAIGVVALLIGGALAIAQDQETLRIRSALGAEDARFREYLARLLGAPLTSGDAYVVHTNGDAAFPAMLDAIGRARHRVSFETYVYDSGEMADRFTAAFDRALAARLTADMERDIGQSVKLDLAGWCARPLHIRGREQLWSFFGEVF